MKCPHCDKQISFFSKALNKFSKGRTCPHCSKAIKVYIDFKIAAILFVPAVALSVYVLQPIFILYGLSDGLATGVITGVLIILSTRLKRVETV